MPLCAKSAATLVCLAADELVVGDLGELGQDDAAELAARLVARALGPLYARLDLVRLGEQARGVQLSGDHVMRVLRRFRPGLPPEAARGIAHALVTAYASHGFVLDREELSDVGVAHRAPDEAEAPLVDAIADALLARGEDVRMVHVFSPHAESGARVASAA